jgi:hypothetical protein
MTRTARGRLVRATLITLFTVGALVAITQVTPAQPKPIPVAKPPLTKPKFTPIIPPTAPTPWLRGTAATTCFSQMRCFVVGQNLPLIGQTATFGYKFRSGSQLIDVPATGMGATAARLSLPKLAAGGYSLGVYKNGALVSNEIVVGVAIASSGSDWDGDGVDGPRAGGPDCDDLDPGRYPGGFEQCDAMGRDQDCLWNSVAEGGTTGPFAFSDDKDRDGLPSAQCCNLEVIGLPLGTDPAVANDLGVYWWCATDCDDGNHAVQINSQECIPGDASSVAVCAPAPIAGTYAADPGLIGTYDKPPMPGLQSPSWQKRACPSGTKCVAQPNGTGVCH